LSRVVALLRGINLAGKRKVSMPDLREHLCGLGHEDVGTYLATGNVLLSSSEAPRALERALTTQISDWLGAQVHVLVRTEGELAAVLELDPLGSIADSPSKYQVTFLSAEPGADVVRRLEAADHGPERVAVRGREIYSWHPDGVGRSKLALLLTERKLGVVPTMRTWSTVTKLHGLLSAS
jgi:uncharacterized protein (DUF1697 family)